MTVPPGTAHMLEHVILRRNVEDQPETGILAKLSSLGIDANAYTSTTHTLFYFTCVESLLEGMGLLFEAVLDPEISEPIVESERKIIRSELDLYFDQPENQLLQQVLENLFHQHPVREDVAGSVESLAQIETQHLEALHRNFFTQDQLKMVVVGDVQDQVILDLLTPLLKDDIRGDHQRALIPEEPVEVKQAEAVMHGPVVNALYALGWKDPNVTRDQPLNGSQLRLRQLAGELYFQTLIGDSSTFYEELYSEGLIDESFRFAYVCEKDWAYLIVSVEAEDAHRTIHEIVQRLPAMVEDGGSGARAFETQKRALTGRFIRSMDDIEACGESAVSAALNHIDLFDFPLLFERLDYERTVKEMSFVTKDEVRTAVTLLPASPLHSED